MKKLALFLTVCVIFTNCTNPKKETKTAAVEIATPTINADTINAENQTASVEKEEANQEQAAVVSSGVNSASNNNSVESKPAKKKWSNKKKGLLSVRPLERWLERLFPKKEEKVPWLEVLQVQRLVWVLERF